ncbi:MAG TPA: hypothetical protein VL096_16655 [Pirellulaceae bacterium]|nr:hypothetical protein [Pirellulaceae bacterium]
MTIETAFPMNVSLPSQFMHDDVLIVNGSTAKPESDNKPPPFSDEFELIDNLIAAWKVENPRRGGTRHHVLLGW